MVRWPGGQQRRRSWL